MAQLTDDCFAFGGKMLSLYEAQDQLSKGAKPRQDEVFCALDALPGRILARDAVSMRHVPPFINSAVDGFAYRAGEGPILTLSGSIVAGQAAPPDTLAPQTAMRVLTGAPMPPGADTVMMDEDAVLNGDQVHIRPELKPGSNVRPQGEDMGKGEKLYAAGARLTGLDVARLAAAGLDGAWVRRPLRIHVLSSGDEIQSGQVADVNRWLIDTVFHGPAFDLTFGGVVPDELEASLIALRGINADLILTSGGVSVGDRDHMRAAIETLGTLAFWRVGIKPGRPVAFGQIDGTPIFGLPGNPVAAYVTAQFLALPYALSMLGHRGSSALFQGPVLKAPLATAYQKKVGRTEFVRVHVDADGSLRPYAIAGAGLITSLTATDALAVLGDDLHKIEPGTWVPVLPLKGLLT